MHGLALLLGHLVGDYLFQRDWEAKLKTVQHPDTPRPADHECSGDWIPVGITPEMQAQRDWDNQALEARMAPGACSLHCLQYTLAVFLFCFWFLPWWAYPVVFLTHWPIDRYRLARKLMLYNGQKEFATGVFAPWSVILVDNILHLIVLFILGLFGT